jgi:hypothetical protein
MVEAETVQQIVSVNEIVEELRRDTRLYLPALTKTLGFSSARTEYLLNRLVARMPKGQCYVEIGVLAGRTLKAASKGNEDKFIYAIDPCIKYEVIPEVSDYVCFIQKPWEELDNQDIGEPVGVVFYDADHSEYSTRDFMVNFSRFLADGAILVLDDWDRNSVRAGAFAAKEKDPRWQLLREMPEYTDGLTTAPHHFGYYFGCSVWRYGGA